MASRVAFMTTSTSACPLQSERRIRERRVRLVPPRVSAQHGGSGDIPPQQKLLLDRRDVLVTLGGTAAAAAATTTAGGVILPAMAAPVAPPDLSKCHNANAPGLGDELQCCPPYTTANIVDYDFPNTPLRVRQPAQLVKNDKTYMDKYKLAIQKMKELDANHPWNYYQQALIHCAYCNEAYDQAGYPSVSLQVHYSWLFLPWHRYYLHFYERILGKLIGDDTFTLPFWNFDSEDGMTLPEIFTADTTSPLYNDNRDKTHYNPALLDYKYAYNNTTGSGLTGNELVQANYNIMQTTYKNSLQLAELFMGDPLRAGETDSTQGTGGLESIHNAVHQWVGPDTSPHTDMGNFATAARDCVFYSLHANVDRLWHVYRNFRGNRVEFPDSDWLNASFIFFDEDERVVRVKVSDCLNPSKLRYTYEEVPLPWMGSVKKTSVTKAKDQVNLVKVSEFGSQPRDLGTEPVRVLVSRPKKSRKKSEKEQMVELILIKNIEVTKSGAARFDVYVAEPDGDKVGPAFGEFAGSFVKLPHKLKDSKGAELIGKAKGKGRKTNLKLGITALLEDIDAEDADKLVITLVPRNGDITVGGVEIKLVQADSPRLIA